MAKPCRHDPLGQADYDCVECFPERDRHVDHPAHYGGEDNPYEAIKVIEAWELDFCLGNTVKYVSRAGKKRSNEEVQDLKKARWYLNRRIEQLETINARQN